MLKVLHDDDRKTRLNSKDTEETNKGMKMQDFVGNARNGEELDDTYFDNGLEDEIDLSHNDFPVFDLTKYKTKS